MTLGYNGLRIMNSEKARRKILESLRTYNLQAVVRKIIGRYG